MIPYNRKEKNYYTLIKQKNGNIYKKETCYKAI